MASTSDEVLEVPGAATGTGNDNTTVRIQPLEIPGMIMISAPLNGNNWLSWSRSVRIALEGRDKLGFIDGSCSRPAEGTPQHKQWRITDYIVRTWILNTISKNIVNAHLYASSSRDLWMELEARYSECDGHNKETCFKIHGFPDWYKDINDQRRRQNINNRAYVVDDSEHKPAEKPDAAGNNLVSDLLEALRIVQNKMPQDPLKVHFAQVTEMTDTGATSHMCGDKSVVKVLYSSSELETYSLWHRRLGHTSPNAKKHINSYDIHNKKTLISRVVTFHESVFPYKSFNIASDNSSFPIPEPISNSFTDSPPTLSQPTEFPNLSESTITPTNTDPSTSTTSSPDIPVPSPILRRSQRHTQPPSWLTDFVKTSSDHISSNLASSHSDFQAALSTVQEPRTYNQAKGCVEWELAMQKELSALEQNETWEVVDLPKGKRAIGSKWVYKVKLNPDGFVERYKARLVAKGYDQIEGIDYFDRFSPVAKSVTASRQWNQELTTKLVQYGFSQSPHDHCLFTKATTTGLLVILVYVDDLLLTGCSESLINEVKVYLDDAFTIKDLGYAKYFLGLEIARSSAGTSVTQHKYVRDIITDAGLENCRPVSTPLLVGLNLTSHAQPALADPEPYRRLVGRLFYLGFTRPDISYGAQQLSQFVHHPSQIHMDVAMHLVRYLKGCLDLGLFFPSSNLLVLKAYCDADWASCVDSRRSLTGYCVFLGDSLTAIKNCMPEKINHTYSNCETL
ncbi:UNVERIFIED_CONTAM: Retrovirus-related Pol polyprotein from transposon RE2 [Sesamum angustifolium]|uniref:Retrovirus-related Pol polyprotein from transposon RE2 n=1 Tax=Sesamum angustifolium TaxID=2727405 RepID=A0AAW2NJQ7_9LAMI